MVRALAGRSEFVTAYTPYQAEVAQGGLQAIFEFQTMVSRLFGLPIANASLYDGASAVVEAVNLGVGATGTPGVLVSAGLHPHWRAVLSTFAAGTGHRLVEVPRWRRAGPVWDRRPTESDVGVVVVGYPNYLGCLEDLAVVRALCDARGALMVVAADPVAAGVLRSPGDWGADVAVGEGQPFGTPLSFGGPYLGLFACSAAHVRRLPGRLVGETLDARRTAGLRDHAAGARAGHPAGEGHLQRLHQPDPDGADRGGPAGLARHARPGRDRPPAAPGRPATAARRWSGWPGWSR